MVFTIDVAPAQIDAAAVSTPTDEAKDSVAICALRLFLGSHVARDDTPGHAQAEHQEECGGNALPHGVLLHRFSLNPFRDSRSY